MSLDITLSAKRQVTVFELNVTHNLGEMARKAGLYYPMWHPDDIGLKTAADVIPLLRAGIAVLRTDPDGFSKFAPENGYGTYHDLLVAAEKYLAACEENPDAVIDTDT